MTCNLLWLFVWLVAGYDTWFAWSNREDFCEWESNPLARLVGVGPAMGYRLVSVGLCWLLARRCRPWWYKLSTVVVALLHVFLVCIYLVIALDS